MAKKEFFGYLCNIASWMMLAVQTDEMLKYIQLGFALFTSLVSFCYTCYKWYKNSRKDGKITKDEVKQLLDAGADMLFRVKTINSELNETPKNKEEKKEIESRWNTKQ